MCSTTILPIGASSRWTADTVHFRGLNPASQTPLRVYTFCADSPMNDAKNPKALPRGLVFQISFAVSVNADTAFSSRNASTLKVTLGKPCLK